MTEYTLSIPENIYQRLLSAAQTNGVSPVEWIATQLPAASKPLTDFSNDPIGLTDHGANPGCGTSVEVDKASQPLSELLSGLTGKIDSKSEPTPIREAHKAKKNDAFGEDFLAKMAKQGIHLP